jgi:hypothetical protein
MLVSAVALRRGRVSGLVGGYMCRQRTPAVETRRRKEIMRANTFNFRIQKLYCLCNTCSENGALSTMLGNREQHWVGANCTSALAARFEAILASEKTRVQY